MRKRLTAILAVFLLSVSLVACSNGGAASATTASQAPAATATAVAPTEAAPSEAAVTCDKFTILNHRTDLAENGDWDKLYVAPFKAKYPGIKEVSVESIRDYHTDVRTRMNTTEYGDVLVIPNGVTASEYASFFEPLGTVEDLKTKYRFIEETGNFEGTVYGIAINGNGNGLLYNKSVFEQAGITEWPKTTDEFLADLKAIKDKVPGVDPLYTNYAAGWPMSQWQPYTVIAVGNADFSAQMAHDASPWDAGKGQYVVDKLLYDVVKGGMNEKDPTTTDWEPSKQLVAEGKIGVMPLGSWAISQIQGVAKTVGADPANIGYMPFPNQIDGKFQSTTGGDLRLAINKNSSCKEAAHAWVNFFLDESGYAANESGIPTSLTGAAPAWFTEFQDAGVNLFSENPAPAGEEGLRDNIAKEAEIDIWGNVYRQAIVDDARGQTDKGMDKVFSDLNEKWAKAKTEVGG
jgi:raffinose/stachyose/melibiose transport system substrate-binding protein